jgi:hypothetical protein
MGWQRPIRFGVLIFEFHLLHDNVYPFSINYHVQESG